jgi:hypothetical protein
MDVRVVRVFFPDWIIGDVQELTCEVVSVCNAMGVVAVLPDFSGLVFARSEGESAFDELGAAFDGVVLRGCEDYVDVVGHDDERVEKKPAGVAVAE